MLETLTVDFLFTTLLFIGDDFLGADFLGADVDRYGNVIFAMIREINPVTNRQYTITEAYESASGKMGQAVDQINAANNAFRNDSKNQLAPTQSSAAPSNGNDTGGLTQTELRTGLANLGFDI